MLLSTAHIIGVILALLAMTAVGLYAGRKVKSAEDFSTSRRQASSALVAGTMMGTMVSGASTIGTAQLAFRFGFSAWWWTLGAGLGFAILGLGFARRLYESSLETVPQYLVSTYGSRIGPIASVFTSLGIYFNFIANVLAFVALFTSILHMIPLGAAGICVLLVLVYVLFGGVWGTGLAGVAKLILVSASMVSCGVIALVKIGGISGLTSSFPSFPWFSLFGRGFSVDFAAGFSMLLGVLSTQTYFQAIVSGRSLKDARKGALISAFMTPPVGLCAIMVGLYMKAVFPKTPSSEVLSVFVLKFLPPVAAGIALATLLITIIGGLAGLALGISTMFTKDIYKRYFRPNADGREALRAQRLAILVVCLISLLFVNDNIGSLILGWSFMSMGLRGCTILFPLLGAMFFSRYVTPAAGIAAALLGPLTDFLWRIFFPKGLDPLYPGLLVSLIVLVFVSMFTKKSLPELARHASTKG
jgi:SSS family solute:Na+ symporter